MGSLRPVDGTLPSSQYDAVDATEPSATGPREAVDRTASRDADTLDAHPASSQDAMLRAAVDLGKRARSARDALETVSDLETPSGSAALSQARVAVRRATSSLAQVVSYAGDAALVGRILDASGRLDRAWDRYQSSPDAATARELGASLDAWGALVSQAADRLPVAHVGAMVSGMVEVGSGLAAQMARVFTERAQRAHAAADFESRPDPRPEAVPDRAAEALAHSVGVAVEEGRAAPDFAEIPDALEARLGRAAADPRVAAKLDQVRELHAELSQVLAERGGLRGLLGRGEREERVKQLAGALRRALNEAGVEFSRAQPRALLNVLPLLASVEQAVER